MAVVPLTVKIAFVLLALGLIIFLIGFVSPYWVYQEIDRKPDRFLNKYITGNLNYGLWTYCRDTDEYDYYSKAYNKKIGLREVDECWSLLKEDQLMLAPDEMRATQFFETVGLIATIVSILLLVMGMCIDSCKERRLLPILSAVLCLAAAGCIIVGTIIFGSTESHKNNLSWAFALAIVGGIILVIAGVLIIIGAVMKK